jgi:hypothetical protein
LLLLRILRWQLVESRHPGNFSASCHAVSEARPASAWESSGLHRPMPRPPETPPCSTPIEQAVRELRPTDWYRLRRAGQILAWKVPWKDAEALLFEALERTLDGRRRWNHKAVDFVGHLIGVMRSIASHEAERRGLNVVALTSSVELIAQTNPENALSAEEQIRRLRSHFGEQNDAIALQVLDAMELGCDGPAIREQLGLDQTQLETVIRRVRRAAAQVLPA